MPWADYNASLEAINLVVRARNFLVFQGDVESLASTSPKDLTAMVEAMCGSGELKPRYEELRDARDRALTQHKLAEQRRKGAAAERKQVREQADEARRFEELGQLRDRLAASHVLFQCFHYDRDLHEQEHALERLAGDEAALAGQRDAVLAALKTAKQDAARVQNQQAAVQKSMRMEKAKLDKRQPEYLAVQQGRTHADRARKQAAAALQRAHEAHAAHTANAARGAAELAAAQDKAAAQQAVGDAAAITLKVRHGLGSVRGVLVFKKNIRLSLSFSGGPAGGVRQAAARGQGQDGRGAAAARRHRRLAAVGARRSRQGVRGVSGLRFAFFSQRRFFTCSARRRWRRCRINWRGQPPTGI